MRKSGMSRLYTTYIAVGIGVIFTNLAFADHHAASESSAGVDPALQTVIDGDHRSAAKQGARPIPSSG